MVGGERGDVHAHPGHEAGDLRVDREERAPIVLAEAREEGALEVVQGEIRAVDEGPHGTDVPARPDGPDDGPAGARRTAELRVHPGAGVARGPALERPVPALAQHVRPMAHGAVRTRVARRHDAPDVPGRIGGGRGREPGGCVRGPSQQRVGPRAGRRLAEEVRTVDAQHLDPRVDEPGRQEAEVIARLPDGIRDGGDRRARGLGRHRGAVELQVGEAARSGDPARRQEGDQLRRRVARAQVGRRRDEGQREERRGGCRGTRRRGRTGERSPRGRWARGLDGRGGGGCCRRRCRGAAPAAGQRGRHERRGQRPPQIRLLRDHGRQTTGRRLRPPAGRQAGGTPG